MGDWREVSSVTCHVSDTGGGQTQPRSEKRKIATRTKKMATMMHHRTCRSRRRSSPMDALESPFIHTLNRLCNFPSSLVFWSLLFAIFQHGAPSLRVVASSASSSVPQAPHSAHNAWQGMFAHDGNSQFPGASASSDDGDDLVESASDEPNEEPFGAAAKQTDNAALSQQADSSETPNVETMDTEDNIDEISVNVEQAEQQSSDEEDEDESASIKSTEMATLKDESESESTSEEETDSESQDESIENSQIQATRQEEVKEQSSQSIEEQEETKQTSIEQETVESDAEAEWFDSDDALVEVTVDVSTISDGDVNTVEPQEVAEESSDEKEEEESPPQPSLSTLQVKPAVENVDETVDDNQSMKEDHESHVPIESALVDESETESDEEEGSVSTNEMESDDEQYDWSEDEMSDNGSTVDEPGPSVPSVKPATPKVSEQPESTRSKDYRSTVSAAKANVSPNDGQRKRRTHRSSRQYGSPHDLDSSQPLKTLEKLQHMLDETDYMTAAPGVRSNDLRRELPLPSPETVVFNQATAPTDSVQKQDSPVVTSPDPNRNREASGQGDKLWTSKDRMKYKKQQAKVRRAKQEQRRLQEQLRSPPLHPNSSDDEETDDTDDGLGFTLPLNLPVYFSDAEGTTDLTDVDHSQSLHQSGHTQHPFQPPPPPPFEQRGPYPYPPPPGFYPPNVNPMQPDQNMGHPVPPYYPPNPYAPYGSYGPYNQQQMASQYAAAWAAAASGGVPPFGPVRPQYRRPYPQASSARMIEPPKPNSGQPKDDTKKEATSEPKPDGRNQNAVPPGKVVEQQFPVTPDFQMTNVPYHLAPAATMGTVSKRSLLSGVRARIFSNSLHVIVIGAALFSRGSKFEPRF